MNPDLTEIAFVMDRSGSMETMKSEAIGGFNHFLDEQKKEPGEVRFTLVLFDNEYLKPFDHMPLAQVPYLNDGTYQPRASTALLDAMGRTIDEIGKRLAATPEHQRPSKVIVACMTDGYENSSRVYSNAKVAQMIEHQSTVYSWEFIFLGATLESRQMARSWTIKEADIMAYAPTPMGVSNALRDDLSARVREKRQSK
ncbi:hypothetical protein GC170_03075 [bacterium]|nr:hypothetical protein [bacterium]